MSEAKAWKTLNTLSNDLHQLKKQGPPTLEEMERLADRTWRTNVMQLNAVMKSIWTTFDELMVPTFKVDDALTPVYQELVRIKQEMKRLVREPVDKKQGLLASLQDRLRDVEDVYYKDGKFVPQGWKQMDPVPCGQAVLSSLLYHCHRMARLENEADEEQVHPALLSIKSDIHDAILSLYSIKERIQTKFTQAEPLELKFVQEKLKKIQDLKKEGHFLDDQGQIAQGQAILNELLEEAYDMAHDCVVEMEHQQHQATGRISDIATSLTEQAGHARDVLMNYITQARDEAKSMSAPLVHKIQSTLSEGVTSLRNAASHPVDTAVGGAKSAQARLASTTRSAFGYLQKVLEKMEPVDPSLQPILIQLGDIRSKLKELRNRKDVLKSAVTEDDHAIQKEQEAIDEDVLPLQRHLNDVENKRVQGCFLDEAGNIAKGQAILSALLEECHVLIVEIQH